jgi:hypothetical protein
MNALGTLYLNHEEALALALAVEICIDLVERAKVHHEEMVAEATPADGARMDQASTSLATRYSPLWNSLRTALMELGYSLEPKTDGEQHDL